MTDQFATIKRDDDTDEVRLQRFFAHPPQRVWAAITDPDQIKAWLMELDVFEPHVGGKIRFTHDCMGPTGEILTLDPPHVFEYTWTGHDPPLSTVRFELVEAEGGTTLHIRHSRLLTRSSAIDHAAGWHTHIEWMEAMLDGTERLEFGVRHSELVDHYTTTTGDVTDV
jgi:uncharacterized protein YndB with AHSA1/START domain